MKMKENPCGRKMKMKMKENACVRKMKMKMKKKMKPCGKKMKMKMKPCSRSMTASITSKGLPTLMIPGDKPKEQFYSVFKRKLCDINIQLPMLTEIDDTLSYCVGCGHGWFAKLQLDCSEQSCERPLIDLLNPFREDQLPICLPPVNGILPCNDVKLILSADPTLNPDNCVVIALSINRSVLSFIKLGQKIWTPFREEHHKKPCRFSDAIFYKGQVYVVENSLGMIVSFDVESSSNSRQQHKALPPANDMFRSSVRAYLVESTNGDLLHVRRFLIIKHQVWDVIESFFMVYKLVFDADGSIVQQVEVKSIGDEALFVGDRSPSISVLASSYPGCQPNSIYYVDDSTTALLLMRKDFDKEDFDYHMAGVFNLEDGTSAQLYSKKYYLHERSDSDDSDLDQEEGKHKLNYVSAPALWFMHPI